MRSILTAMITVAAFLVPLPVSAVSITGKYVGRGLDFMVGRNEEKVGPTGEKAGPQHLEATIKRIRLQKYQVELSSYRLRQLACMVELWRRVQWYRNS